LTGESAAAREGVRSGPSSGADVARSVVMRELRLIVVPYELGRRGEGVGAGPERLLAEGAEAALGDAGGSVSSELVELDARFGGTGYGDVDAGFELIRVVGRHVAAARAGGALPVLLSGSCFVAVGVVAGLGSPPPAVAWFDAHSDFNTPQTSLEGYFDGMGLAVLTGGAWQGMLASVPDATPLAEQSVVLAGARDFEPPERQRLASSSIRCVTAEQLRDPAVLLRTLGAAGAGDHGVYLHVDLDVLDRSVAEVNVYAAPGGPDADQLVRVVEAIADSFEIRAASLTAYDPTFDILQQIPPIANRLLNVIGQRREPRP
jgi:arginase